jgi:hypothetical protein
LNEKLLRAVKQNQAEDVRELLNRNANPIIEDKDGWTPLIWAAVKGHEEIIRILIKHNACEPYLSAAQGMEGEQESEDKFKKPKVAAVVGKYNPLHWASYKGFLRIVWLLLKEGMSPIDFDIYGNNSVHQACSGGQLEILQCFLSQGVDVEIMNARRHTPLHLSTQPSVKEIVVNAIKTEVCQKKSCKSRFDFANVRYYCQNCTKFFCRNCKISMWVYEAMESTSKEKPVCYCQDCYDLIKRCEEKFQDALASVEFEVVDRYYKEVLDEGVGGQIEVKLMHEMQVYHTKLHHELLIRNFIRSLDVVPIYKTIKKSVKLLNDKVEDAKNKNVELSPSVIAEANQATRRLIAERNLR